MFFLLKVLTEDGINISQMYSDLNNIYHYKRMIFKLKTVKHFSGYLENPMSHQFTTANNYFPKEK